MNFKLRKKETPGVNSNLDDLSWEENSSTSKYPQLEIELAKTWEKSLGDPEDIALEIMNGLAECFDQQKLINNRTILGKQSKTVMFHDYVFPLKCPSFSSRFENFTGNPEEDEEFRKFGVAIELIMKYLYCQPVVLDHNNVNHVLKMATKYKLDRLVVECNQFLKDRYISVQLQDQPPINTLTMLNNQRRRQHHCDVEFILIGNFMMRAHRAILSNRNEYFKKKFNSVKNLGTLNDIRPVVFDAILTVIYTGVISIPSRCALDMMVAGVFFKMPDVIAACEQFSLKYIVSTNCLYIYCWANLNCRPIMAEKAARVFYDNFDELTATAKFREMCHIDLYALIKCANYRYPGFESMKRALQAWNKGKPAKKTRPFAVMMLMQNLFAAQQLLAEKFKEIEKRPAKIENRPENIPENQPENPSGYVPRKVPGNTLDNSPVHPPENMPEKSLVNQIDNQFEHQPDQTESDDETETEERKKRKEEKEAEKVLFTWADYWELSKPEAFDTECTFAVVLQKNPPEEDALQHCGSQIERFCWETARWQAYWSITGLMDYSAIQIGYEIYIAGGIRLDVKAGFEYMSRVFVLNLKAPVSYDIKEMNQPRYSFSMTYMDGMMYCCGGGRSKDGKSDGSVERYNGSWKYVAPMIMKWTHTTAFALNGYLYVFGGRNSNMMCQTTVQRYDPRKNKWSLMCPMIHKRSQPQAYQSDGYIFLIGGVPRGEYNTYKASVEAYDTVRNTWTMVQNVGDDRYCMGTLMNKHCLFVFNKEQTRHYDIAKPSDDGINIRPHSPCHSIKVMASAWNSEVTDKVPTKFKKRPTLLEILQQLQ